MARSERRVIDAAEGPGDHDLWGFLVSARRCLARLQPAGHEDSETMKFPGEGKLRVGFDISSTLGRRPRGIASYIHSLLPALARSAPHVEPILFIRDERWFRRRAVADLLPGAKRRWLLPLLGASRRAVDVFHGMGTHLPAGGGPARSFTLHDLREFDTGEVEPSPDGKTGCGRKERTARLADRILAISHHCKARLLHHLPGLDPDSIEVIHHGVDHSRFFPREPGEQKACLERAGIQGLFFIQVGSFFPHKNLELSLRAFAQSHAPAEGFRLVLAGGGGSREYRKKLIDLQDSLSLNESVVWIEDLSSEILPIIVSAARGLLMPSRYEGFGLPVLEAMASGVPGVTSNSTSLPEVGGGVWDCTEVDDVDGFAEAINTLALNDEEHAVRAEAGLVHSQGFTWEKTARQTAAFLGRVHGVAGGTRS